MPRYVLALDGGGTKTVAWLADETGRVLGAGRGGPVNVGFVPESVARASIADAVTAALAAVAGLRRVDVVCAGATLTPELIEAALRAVVGFDRLVTPGEAPCCLASGSADDHGAVILSGTGCFQWARGRTGQVHRTDGWGALLGDQGSAYDLARTALVAAARATDGRGPGTCLVDRLCAHFQVADLRQATRRIYQEPLPRHQLARLAVEVAAAAAAGDAVALGLLAAAADRLAEGAEVCAARVGLGDEPFDLVLQGGVMRAGPPLLDPLRQRLARSLPAARVVHPRHGPELGALRLALRALGAPAAPGPAAVERRCPPVEASGPIRCPAP